MTEIVKEFKTVDGLGAMLWKKLYAMCYAYENNLIFENTVVSDYIVHPSDNVNTPKEMQQLSNKFFSIINNPWSNINFNDINNKTLCSKIGQGVLDRSNAGIDYNLGPKLLLNGPVFNKITSKKNNIVIHIRRSNAIKENPRYTDDAFYINVLSQISEISKIAGLKNPEVIICTDAPSNETTYKPINKIQEKRWTQPWLEPDEDGIHKLTSLDFDLYSKTFPGIKFINNLGPVESMGLMLSAGVLIVANSAFSQSAGILSSNNVIGTHPKNGINPLYNNFKNRIASLDPSGFLVN
jgi:hypothetical protein